MLRPFHFMEVHDYYCCRYGSSDKTRTRHDGNERKDEDIDTSILTFLLNFQKRTYGYALNIFTAAKRNDITYAVRQNERRCSSLHHRSPCVVFWKLFVFS
mmetsp:Transcript_20214/g.48210  ORF Transcript_20214/g.48210 Transcript_20214/m.48210 type:complete len:100 (+) Transcript_20214:499-798(+)